MVLRSGRLAILAMGMWGVSAGGATALCVRGVEGWDSLRVRTAPTPAARELGGIPANACGVAIVGPCRGAWCPVAWHGRMGWSNSYFLAPGGLRELFQPPRAFVMAPPPPAPARRLVRGPEPRRQVAVVPPPAPKRMAVIQPRPEPPPLRSVPRGPVVRDLPRSELPPAPLAPPAPPPPPVAVAPAPAPAPTPAPATAGVAVVVAPPASGGPPPQVPGEVCVVNVPKGDTLKVRAGPGLDQTLRFGFAAGACGVKVTGPCKDGWCPVDYRGYKGWAEQKFLK